MNKMEETGEQKNIRMMTRYMAWANKLILNDVERIPAAEIVKPRKAVFGSIVHTLNHIFVIEDIFAAHLEGRTHGYSSRNTDTPPPFEDVKISLQKMDQYYVDLSNRISIAELNERIDFEFIGGGKGSMTRCEILLHLVNHSTYHRGHVSDMLFQISYNCAANDLPVFLRDAV